MPCPRTLFDLFYATFNFRPASGICQHACSTISMYNRLFQCETISSTGWASRAVGPSSEYEDDRRQEFQFKKNSNTSRWPNEEGPERWIYWVMMTIGYRWPARTPHWSCALLVTLGCELPRRMLATTTTSSKCSLYANGSSCRWLGRREGGNLTTYRRTTTRSHRGSGS